METPRDSANDASPFAGSPPAERLPSGAEQRAAPRFTLLLRVAKLIVDGHEYFCIIRDASATGVKVKLFAPLANHVELTLELGSGDRYQAECVWTAGDHAGLRFLHPIAVEHLLDETLTRGPRRQIRLNIAIGGILRSGGEAVPISLHDISLQGAGITSDKWLLVNELVKVETPILPPIYAKIRWRDHPRYGLIFENTFRLEDLARRCSGIPSRANLPPSHFQDISGT
ncbi:PilZ domain-containing protein [Novosphingobium nitrogenifigens]|uniref:PilZ domain-containing protein n=1 Tax=Novosphingobium nitrogenifigens TaxID=378548 RepID=UPI000362E640|nr:PilZ domain-containing protein [Novosphingobium nitrogenifigens]